MQLVAINWHVYLLTKSPLALGAVGLVRVVPIILCSLLGGLVADAFDRKRLIIIAQTSMLLETSSLKPVAKRAALLGIADEMTVYEIP